jgi:hypothetical protein
MGNTIEYYVHEAVVGDQYKFGKGNVTTILPNESIQVMTDVHLFIDGLVPITYGRPIQFEEGKWFFSSNCNCILDGDKSATICRLSGHFLDIAKRAEEEFFASNQSKKLLNVTMHFIIEFSLNLSIHI